MLMRLEEVWGGGGKEALWIIREESSNPMSMNRKLKNWNLKCQNVEKIFVGERVLRSLLFRKHSLGLTFSRRHPYASFSYACGKRENRVPV